MNSLRSKNNYTNNINIHPHEMLKKKQQVRQQFVWLSSRETSNMSLKNLLKMVRQGFWYQSRISFISLSVLILMMTQVSSRNSSDVINEKAFDFLSFFTTTTTVTPAGSPTPPSQGNFKCKCGTKSQPLKIIDGTLSKQNAWPWVAAMVTTSNNVRRIYCGASVITTKYLLTAAHCVYLGFNTLTVIVGTNNLNDNGALEYQIASKYIHPKFNPITLEDDIALVELESRITFSEKVFPICLTPQVGVPFANKSAIVAGWGRTSTAIIDSYTTMQRQAVISVFSKKECQARYKNVTAIPLKDITDSKLCASGSTNNRGSCQGDSGSPLFLLKKGSTDSYLQIGIVSAGNETCANSKYPGIYTRVSRYTKWIQKVLLGETFCM
ncbi:Venom serine protease Bi-VSP [Orchesella cincta]|uniref:Venom serine protease Bi-VSP n=1 Tax=Orchesella cincta TaxID=48709 RepID=A0A1D2N623_ORCCI|nr:Venom serine protease Bi-VSP [Orchesella cincta]